VFQILKEISRGQPCDITGISDYGTIDERGGVQWPLPEGASEAAGERRLFADGCFFTDDGKAWFIFDPPRTAPELPDADFPFTLLTGRGTSAQWHTGTRTEKSDVLRKLAPGGIYLELNPLDADRLGIDSGDEITVTSRRAAIVAKAFVTATVQKGQVFIPMHYAEVNQLTLASFDPHSRQPSYKACAVRVSKTTLRRSRGLRRSV
jgi:assimilatory nitrate reductase catalytic subunit